MRASRALFGFVLVVAACGGGKDATAPTDPISASVGTYSLTKVNGSATPAVYYQNSAGTVSITGGSLVLRSDHSYTQSVTAQATYTSGAPSQSSPLIENGTYDITGSQITFTIPADANGPALSYTGAVSKGIVSYTYDGDSFEFHKQ